MDGDMAWACHDWFSFPRGFVHLFPSNLDRGIGWRHLVNLTNELPHRHLYLITCHLSLVTCRFYLSRTIICVGFRTQQKDRLVIFIESREVFHFPRGFAPYRNNEKSGRKGIERAGMAYTFFSSEPTDAVDHIMGSEASGLVDQEETRRFHNFFILPCLRKN